MTEPVPGWSVDYVKDDMRYVPGVGPVEGFNVTFTTKSGVTGSVFVPTAQIGDVNRVAALVQQRVEELHAVHTLSG